MSQRYLGGIITANPTTPTTASASGVWTLEQQFQYLQGVQAKKIGQSVRLRSSASAYFNRTAGTPTNPQKITWSAWVKRGSLGSAKPLMTSDDGSYYEYFGFDSSDKIVFTRSASDGSWSYTSTAVFRDPSAWYHMVVSVDMTQSTNRLTVYMNGVSVLTGAVGFQNQSSFFDISGRAQTLGSFNRISTYFDGYLAETNFIDGQALTPSSFGAFDGNGVWQPLAYTGTYGTNGFYLTFADNSSNTATTLGKDYSGNGNNWTPNNISVTSGVTYDWMLDSPSNYADGGNGRGNYATLNPLLGGVNNAVMTNGNLTATLTYSSQVNAYSNIPLPTTGKWYWESTVVSNNYGVNVGIRSTVNSSLISAGGTGGYSYYNANGNKYDGATASAYGASWYGASRTDVIGVSYDADTRELSFYLNGSSQGVAFTVAAGEYFPSSSHVSGSGSHTEHYNFGQRPFAYTPPTGFKALNTQNLPAVNINNGAQYMAATLYTGNGSTQSISNGANNPIATTFQPDFVWIKNRTQTYNHILQDSVRGTGVYLSSSTADADQAASTAVTAFNSNGFSIGSISGGNFSGNAIVGWQWKAGGTAVSNTNGSITSSVSANTTAGFSVVTFTAPASGNFTVGHGLNASPAMMILKDRAAVVSWVVWHKSLSNPAQSYLSLSNTNAAGANTTVWGNTAPTSTVMTLGVGGAMNASDATVAYCFSEVAGYSKFGSYTGNGSSDGPFVYCGFRPRFVMFKRTDGVENWYMWDTSRGSINVMQNSALSPNLSNAEFSTTASFDILSNGFKMRAAGNEFNGSGMTYIYMAFAENPFNLSRAR